MTTGTEAVPPIALPAGPPRPARFLGAFLAGLLLALAVAAAAAYGFDRYFEGHVLPGVRVGTVDLSGASPEEARKRLLAAYGGISSGSILLTSPVGSGRIPFEQIGRRADVEAMVAEAMSRGRSGSALERVAGSLRIALNGVVLEPRVGWDAASLEERVRAAVAPFELDPVDARVELTLDRFALTAGANGRSADWQAVITELSAALGRVEAPTELEIAVVVTPVAPATTTIEAILARASAERIARDVVLADGDDAWQIPASTIRGWISFSESRDGTYEPVVDTTELAGVLGAIAEKVERAPRNATFVFDENSAIVGVNPSVDGRSLDVEGTADAVVAALRDRSERGPADPIRPALFITAPALTTEEAEKAAPLMARVGTWTTYFPIGEKNGFGANIWIPSSDIDGYVVGPGETFDFWKAIGPVTRERGYRDGGAIINGRTEPQGALAGGICSTSTTLFNAALRAGYKMGARRNHYYYIERYPLGLDATVFKSASGSTQTMSWTNDTEYPVIIRGINTRKGNDGYVRFDLLSVPLDRRVTLSTPIVRNVRKATDTVQYTSSLPSGVTHRREHPVDGKDVWVTRTVTDPQGRILHQETYYSHYARITGILLVGTAGAPPPQPAPAPAAPAPAAPAPAAPAPAAP